MRVNLVSRKRLSRISLLLDSVKGEGNGWFSSGCARRAKEADRFLFLVMGGEDQVGPWKERPGRESVDAEVSQKSTLSIVLMEYGKTSSVIVTECGGS